MSNKLKLAILGIATLVLLTIIGIWMNISCENQSTRLRNLATAEQDVCMTVRDTMFTTIRDQAQISNKYYDKLKELIEAEMSGRYAEGQPTLMKFVQENTQKVDAAVITQLMTTVEAQRTRFQSAQKKLRSVKNQHDDLIGTFPGSFLIDDRTPIEVTIVTTSGTREVYQTGIDNSNPLDAAEGK